MINTHSFHIPVMGIGFTTDTPLKVAHLGIDSVLSLVGQPVHERLRKLHSEENGISYEEITDKDEDYRARRTTAYLNLINKLINKKFENYQNSPLEYRSEIEKCIELLPDNAKLKKEFHDLIEDSAEIDKCKNWITDNLKIGSIDVNIMTKLDRENYANGEKLPPEDNDGHAAIRGYAKSDLASSLVLSAGLNPRLFTYMEQFKDFFPDENGYIKKKITLKVSDYRSALVQGKFLAKKGLWVSEYRIESGLNCGGHAFATDGLLMGPILAEFKKSRNELFESVFDVLKAALETKGHTVSKDLMPFKLTAQGGVGTNEEHQFLLKEYDLNSVGWGSPFLLVPEVTNVDNATMMKIIEAKEDDFYLSRLSPMGVPMNILKGTSKEIERDERIKIGKPGSPCLEGNLALFNTEFTDKPVCTASRQYQNLKIQDLKKQDLDPQDYQKQFNAVVEKTCLCTGLVNSVLLVNNLSPYPKNDGVSICPGPNMLYFKQIMTLAEMTDHIYGKKSFSFSIYRPHMFIKELYANIVFLTETIEESREEITKKIHNRLSNFSVNLLEGIDYYRSLFGGTKEAFSTSKANIISELKKSAKKIQGLQQEISELAIPMSA